MTTVVIGRGSGWGGDRVVTEFDIGDRPPAKLALVSACLQALAGHSGGVESVRVTPDGRRAVSGSCTQTVSFQNRVWDLESGACLQTLAGHRDLLAGLHGTPNGRRAVSGSWDQIVRVWLLLLQRVDDGTHASRDRATTRSGRLTSCAPAAPARRTGTAVNVRKRMASGAVYLVMRSTIARNACSRRRTRGRTSRKRSTTVAKTGIDTTPGRRGAVAAASLDSRRCLVRMVASISGVTFRSRPRWRASGASSRALGRSPATPTPAECP